MDWLNGLLQTLERWASKGLWAVVGLITLATVSAGAILYTRPQGNDAYVRIVAFSVLVAIPVGLATVLGTWAIKRAERRKTEVFFDAQLAAVSLGVAPQKAVLSIRLFLRGSGKRSKTWKLSLARITADFVPNRHKPLKKELVLPEAVVDRNGDVGIEVEWVLDNDDVAWLKEPVSRFCYLNVESIILETNNGLFEGRIRRVALNAGHIGKWGVPAPSTFQEGDGAFY